MGKKKNRILTWVFWFYFVTKRIPLMCLPVSQFSSVTQSHPTLCNPMYYTCVHRVGDAIQLSLPLSSPSPPVLNLSQHWGFFKWVSFSNQVTRLLELQLQHQYFQWIFRTDFLEDGLVLSPFGPRDSQEPSPTPQFKSISSLVPGFLYSPTLTSINDYWKHQSFD